MAENIVEVTTEQKFAGPPPLDGQFEASCLQENLKCALNFVKGAVGTRRRLPVLSNVLIEAAPDNCLYVTASDLDFAIRVLLPGIVERYGSMTVPHSDLFKIVKTLSPERVDMVGLPATMMTKFSCGATTFRLNGISGQEFPAIRTEGFGGGLAFCAEDLYDAISEVIKIAATDDSRPILTGICFKLNDDQSELTLVASDSYRLAVRTLPVPNILADGWDSDRTAVLPVRALKALDVVFKNEVKLGGDVRLMRDPDGETIHVFFEASRVHAVIRQIDGTFPDYTTIVPGPSEDTVQLELYREDLLRVIKRARPIADQSNHTARLYFDHERNRLYVRARASETGEMESVVDVHPDRQITQDIEIAFNAKFIEEMLSSMKSYGWIVLGLISSDRPGVVRLPGRDDLVYVIMPMFIGDKWHRE